MKGLLLLWMVFFPLLVQAGRVYTVKTVPNPKLYNNTYVSDPDHWLKPETVQQLNTELAALEQVTTDQVAVVVLGSIGQEEPKSFATGLFNRFRVGQKDKDNGLLILLVMDQHRVEFETGYGMEGVLTDALCKRIQVQQMVPLFKDGKYDEGILAGVHAVIEVLSHPGEEGVQFANLPDEQTDFAEIGRIAAWIMAVPYLLFMFIFYFVKKARGSFSEDYQKLSEAKKRNISLTIPRWRWLALYILLPLLFYAFMINVYTGPYYLPVLLAGIYLMVLLVLLDKKIRSTEAYRASIKEDDYYDQYNKFGKYFDNWGIAAVFFPLPFLFTDASNGRKLKALRRHERNCSNCGTAMNLLDEKKDDEYLLKSQILEESLKSVDYDVWLCPSCHTHYALSYPSKVSKYKACSYCGTRSSFMESDITLVPADYDQSGTGEKTYKCMYCKKVTVESYSIPRLTRSDNSSGSSSSSDSGSFGGGESGGGGAGSSW